jgi:hypothetical protein
MAWYWWDDRGGQRGSELVAEVIDFHERTFVTRDLDQEDVDGLLEWLVDPERFRDRYDVPSRLRPGMISVRLHEEDLHWLTFMKLKWG